MTEDEFTLMSESKRRSLLNIGLLIGELLLGPLGPTGFDQSSNIEGIEKGDQERTLVVPSTAFSLFFLAILVEEDLVGLGEEASGMPNVENGDVDKHKSGFEYVEVDLITVDGSGRSHPIFYGAVEASNRDACRRSVKYWKYNSPPSDKVGLPDIPVEANGHCQEANE